MVNNQAYLFLIFTLDGFIIGLLFDFFRILRKSFKTSDLVTYIQDTLFWILTGLLVLYSIFIFNNGQIRLFMFLGIFLGVTLYILTISQYIIKINVFIICKIKNIVIYIFNLLSYPLKFIIKILKKIFYKPILSISKNIKKTTKNSIDFSTKKFKKMFNNKKLSKNI